MFEKLPFWGQLAVFVAIAAAIVGVAYWLWPGIEDQGIQIDRLKGELSSKQAQIDEGRAI